MKKFFAGIRDHAFKLLIAAIVLVIACAILSDKQETISIILFLVAGLLFVLFVIGLVLKILNGMAKGVKKITSAMNKNRGRSFPTLVATGVDKEKDLLLLEGGNIKMSVHLYSNMEYKGKRYAIVQPRPRLDGMGPNDVLVFRLTETNSKYYLDLEPNDKIVDGVLKKYNRG